MIEAVKMAASWVVRAENFLSTYLTIAVVCLSLSFVLSYEPIKIEIPQDGGTLRIFSDNDLRQYDGSNVSLCCFDKLTT